MPEGREMRETHPRGEENTAGGPRALQGAASNIGAAILRDLEGDPERAGELERTLRQPLGQKAASAAALVIIAAMAHRAQPGEMRTTTISKMQDVRGGKRGRPRKRTGGGRPPKPRAESPGFNPAGELAAELAGLLSGEARLTVLRQAARAAQRMCVNPERGGMPGMLVQRFTANRKDLAVFHTKPEAAELMACLAVPEGLDWGNPDAMANFRISDYACGAGQLLASAYQRVRTLCRRAGLDPGPGHRNMMERNITGFDVLPASVALTAANLAMVEPGEPFRKTRISRLHIGRLRQQGATEQAGLGSLDILDPRRFRAQERQPVSDPRMTATERKRARRVTADAGSQDLVIMNPPFTQHIVPHRLDQGPMDQGPVDQEHVDQGRMDPPGENGADGERTRELMDAAARDIAGRSGAGQTGNAAFHFTAVAHRTVRRGGTVAMILPVTAVNPETRARKRGPAVWKKFMERLGREYRDVVIISVAQYEELDSAFSHDTHTPEAMVIARRTLPRERGDGRASFINLHRLPRDREDAARTAERIRETLAGGPDPGETRPLLGGAETLGSVTVQDISGDRPPRATGMLDYTVAEEALRLEEGEIPGAGPGGEDRMPMTSVGAIGESGPTVDEIRKLLAEMGEGDFPMMEGHDCNRQRSLSVMATRLLSPRAGMEENAARMLNNRGALLHISEDCRYNSQSTAACTTMQPAMAGRGWTTVRMGGERFEKTVVVFMNTTMGLICHWNASTLAQRGMGHADRSVVMAMRVLDVKALGPAQLMAMERIFEEWKSTPMLPANEAWRDPERQELDRRVIEDVLGLGPEATWGMAGLRNRWCREPTVQGRKGARKSRMGDMENLGTLVSERENTGALVRELEQQD